MNRTKSIAIVLSVAAVCIALILMLPAVLSARTYRASNALYDAGQYEEALAAFEALGAYRDSAALAGACRSAIAQQKYDAAKALYDAGEYAPAYPLLNGLSFSNSAELAAKCLYRIQADRLTGAAAGDTIRFGSYEQDNDLSNGAEEIEWIVLDVDKNAALVISKYVLDIGAFNDEYSESSNITWGICQLREWLNGPFYSAAFGPDHRGRILTSEVPAGKNPESSVRPGKDTKDRIFLLSMEEAYRYFDSDSARRCFGTPYSYAVGAETDGDGACYWWLRSPGIEPSSVTLVTRSGVVFPNGFSCGHLPYPGIRPVMRIDLGTDR